MTGIVITPRRREYPNLSRAFFFVKRQLIVRRSAFTTDCQAQDRAARPLIVGMRALPRHSRAYMERPISAWFSQLPCFGV